MPTERAAEAASRAPLPRHRGPEPEAGGALDHEPAGRAPAGVRPGRALLAPAPPRDDRGDLQPRLLGRALRLFRQGEARQPRHGVPVAGRGRLRPRDLSHRRRQELAVLSAVHPRRGPGPHQLPARARVRASLGRLVRAPAAGADLRRAPPHRVAGRNLQAARAVRRERVHFHDGADRRAAARTDGERDPSGARPGEPASRSIARAGGGAAAGGRGEPHQERVPRQHEP